ncbi:MAG: hypothetical protein AAB592_00685 [Patescibacteria group bacterium]
MSTTSIFFLIFLATIVIVRAWLYYRPTSGPTIFGVRTHHYMYGIATLLIGLLIKNIPIFAIGLGLFIDELMFLLMDGKTHEDNYSKKSLTGLCAFVVIVYILRDFIILFVL